MATARQAKAVKHALADSEQPGTSQQVPAKWNRKSQAPSKGAKSSSALAKEELRLHQAIECSIQKALREASMRESDQAATTADPATPPLVGAPATRASTPALSPDGDPPSLEGQGGVNEVLFGLNRLNPHPQGLPRLFIRLTNFSWDLSSSQ